MQNFDSLVQRDTPLYFPPPESADEHGLLGVGGELSPPWLVDAYSHGIFPWPIFADELILAWWSLDPRAIIEFDQLHISRRFRRRLRSGQFCVTFNQCFSEVVHGCATAQDRKGATWITSDIHAAYLKLHTLGIAHSVEVWQDGALAGGLYGIAIGGLFAAESMFHYRPDASKVAVAYLVTHLKSRRFCLLDIQELSFHTESLGATTIPRQSYLHRLRYAVKQPLHFGDQPEGDPARLNLPP